jgi:hypothetical protein
MWRAIFGAILATGLSGCAFNDQFEGRVARFDVAVTQSRDAMILANIVRASRAEPLSFVQVGKVSGTNTQTGTMGLPSIIFGPHVAAATSAATHTLQGETIFGSSPGGGQGYTGNSTSISGSTNFEVSPTETKQFYEGLLTEVEPRTLEFFRRQGIARELLFYLFTDRVIVDRGGKEIVLQNDPLGQSFDAFQGYVTQAMDYGLSSEPIPGKAARNKSKDKSKDKESANKNDKKDQSSNVDGDDGWHLCFDPKEKAPNVVYTGNAPLCGHPGLAGQSRTVQFLGHDGAKVSLTVLPRSVFAIFQYLGRLIDAGERGRVKLHSAEAIDYGPLHDEYLFDIEKGGTGACFAAVEQDGETYCVPQQGATNTKRILGLLIQLIALNTSIQDIPVTPSVRIVP